MHARMISAIMTMVNHGSERKLQLASSVGNERPRTAEPGPDKPLCTLGRGALRPTENWFLVPRLPAPNAERRNQRELRRAAGAAREDRARFRQYIVLIPPPDQRN